MTDLTARAPFNPDKVNELHDQKKVAPPGPVTRDFVRRWHGVIAAIVMTVIFMTLAFFARAGWDNHREWVVALLTPGCALAGVAFGGLIFRREFAFMSTGLIILLFCGMMTAGNIWRGYETTGNDGFRDALAIMQGILLVIAGVVFLTGLVLTEWRKPIRAPQPEM